MTVFKHLLPYLAAQVCLGAFAELAVATLRDIQRDHVITYMTTPNIHTYMYIFKRLYNTCRIHTILFPRRYLAHYMFKLACNTGKYFLQVPVI